MPITRLIIENFRCFHSLQSTALAPLTILVGENSTGKSSFLAAVRLAGSLRSSNRGLDFNEPPFELGSFEQIANFRGGRGGRAKTFSLGFEDSALDPQSNDVPVPFQIQAKFTQQNVQPYLSEWLLRSADVKLTISMPTKVGKMALHVETSESNFSREVDLKFSRDIPLEFFTYFALMLIEDKVNDESSRGLSDSDKVRISSLLTLIQRSSGDAPFASAPIRSRPVRTYDPQRETPLPEGGHIPMVLSRTISTSPAEWESLKRSLEDFSRACGLFDSITVRRLGHTESGPFQIQVKIAGPAMNLIDVGYGVSQVLPILVDSLMLPPERLLLLQQPEVHLHPRAQAELGTFLGQLVKADHKRFVVETHSDFFIDRVCQDVRDGVTLTPNDVLILFFERDGADYKIHPITVDSMGNIIGAPSSYRAFFLQEQQRFLGI